jgi:hypothetical protein
MGCRTEAPFFVLSTITSSMLFLIFASFVPFVVINHVFNHEEHEEHEGKTKLLKGNVAPCFMYYWRQYES